MASTYEKIATTTLGSSQASIDFTSISGSYTDLVIVGSIKAATAGPQLFVIFNNDTGSNYSVTNLYNNGTSAGSTRFASSYKPKIRLNYVVDPNTSEYCTLIMNLNNYSNTTTYKTALSKLALGGGSNSGLDITASLWQSTTAINRVTFTMADSASDFASGCTFTIYGILKA